MTETERLRAVAAGWNAEATRYRAYAAGSTIPGELRSVAKTLDGCADELRAALAVADALGIER